MDISTPSRKVVLISLSLFLFFGIFAVANFIHELQALFAFMSGETVPAYSDICRAPGVNCAELPVLRDYVYDVFRAFL